MMRNVNKLQVEQLQIQENKNKNAVQPEVFSNQTQYFFDSIEL